MDTKGKELKVGILFSLTGPTSITERGQCQASLLAIRQINEQGGIHGKRLVPIVEDIASDPYLAAQKAEKLILSDQVIAIIGLYTSACRKMVIPVLEKYDRLLFYPTLYEGAEQHRNIFYCGPLPNQQLLHFIPWIITHLGKTFYLIGSDYIYPRETNRYIRNLVQSYGGTILDEKYVGLGDQKFSPHMQQIRRINPDVIFSTLVGNSAGAFYQQHHQYALKQHIASSITAETEITAIQPSYTVGLFSSFPYFNTVENPVNQQFVAEYRRTYGTDTISSVMENAYNSVFLLAKALRSTRTVSTDAIRRSLSGLALEAPQGQIIVDEKNQHLWLNSRIGRVDEKCRFQIVWESDSPLPPVPFFEIEEKKTKTVPNELPKDMLEKRLTRNEFLLKELKKATHFYPFTFAFFDSEGVLLDVFQNGASKHSAAVPQLKIGSSNWIRHPLNKSGIGLALTGHTLSYACSDEHEIQELQDWITTGLPVKSKSDSSRMGVLGVFIHKNKENAIPFLLESMSRLAAYCAELTHKHNDYLSLSTILQDISGQLSKSLFVLKQGKILFHNASAQDLLARKGDLVHMSLAEISSDNREEANYIMRTEDSDSLFEIEITKSLDCHYVYFKQLAHRTSAGRKDKTKMTTKDLIGSNEHFLRTVSLAKSASKTNANVLLLGESGTGKELFARAIHNESSRKEKPFVAINCAAIPKELINAELFGYMEGAFTGAKKGGNPGKFEAANGGTLFLDEIGDMPFELQATLLRVLQEKEVIRVGGHKPIPIDVRIIAATNKNLNQEIAYNGSFRSDLFYRLNVFTIELVPLRERLQDVAELSSYYIHELSVDNGVPVKEISPEALKVLTQYKWQGNIRELNNVMERAFYLSDRSAYITVEHLPSYIVHNLQNEFPHQPNSVETFQNLEHIKEIKQRERDLERNFYIQALIQRKGNISRTAKELGISRTTLYRKLDENNIKFDK
ncbi:transporter substrate-binding protein [Paenibacillus naphthalenovorans]|uniref:Fis family transcriptional regulator n=1 Tax=Paenibacillus naphthalenovorans TaxID=162209 RepID=A0A0U2VZJ6_9BACL|nr:transporter substrate-binding protein [Paenibacillus naphthalenovorans]ALS20541.1 Fis family transcriptional regulator [Paenibacillus naphthalenovorans]